MSDSLAIRDYPALWQGYTVFDPTWPAGSFNPHAGFPGKAYRGGGRFHPFPDARGVAVPTLYLADHPNGAIAEVVMRDEPGRDTVSHAELHRYSIATLGFRRALRLADLVDPATTSAEILQLLGDGEAAYPALRSVANTLHLRHPGIDGLVWQGRQLATAGMNCMVLFGDRVDTRTDLMIHTEIPLHRGLGLSLMRDAARATNFALAETDELAAPAAPPADEP